jgi:hypothetical protein
MIRIFKLKNSRSIYLSFLNKILSSNLIDGKKKKKPVVLDLQDVDVISGSFSTPILLKSPLSLKISVIFFENYIFVLQLRLYRVCSLNFTSKLDLLQKIEMLARSFQQETN